MTDGDRNWPSNMCSRNVDRFVRELKEAAAYQFAEPSKASFRGKEALKDSYLLRLLLTHVGVAEICCRERRISLLERLFDLKSKVISSTLIQPRVWASIPFAPGELRKISRMRKVLDWDGAERARGDETRENRRVCEMKGRISRSDTRLEKGNCIDLMDSLLFDMPGCT
jgi:hypothetical protein